MPEAGRLTTDVTGHAAPVIYDYLAGARPLRMSSSVNKLSSADRHQASQTGIVPDRRQSLALAVRQEVIPRLILNRRGDLPAPGLAGFEPASVDAFARLLLTSETSLAMRFAERARSGGVSLDKLCLDLLAPAARHLGDLWSEDRLSFAQVTIGLGRLHYLLRKLSPALPSEGAHEFASSSDAFLRRAVSRVGRRVLLVPAPGEQHSFGLAMVTEFFRRRGWPVWSSVKGPELLAVVRENWFAIVGFSLGHEARLDALANSIRAVRKATPNRRLRVMVGGPVFLEHPEYMTAIGADAMAIDGHQAVLQAEALLTMLPCQTRVAEA